MTRLILQDATIIDGENAPRRGTLVISGDRIEAVGAAPVEAGPGDRVVALGGRTVMPGMILGHYHAAYWKMKAGTPLGLDAPTPLQALRAASNLQLALESGFTGVISAGAPNAIDPALKAAIAEGTIKGPHMVACSRDVSATGHSSDMSFPAHWDIRAKGGVNRADGADAFRRVVREEIKDGAEIIKLFVTRGHATGGTGGEWEMTREEFAAAVGAAHDRGVKVRAHIANRDAVLAAIDLGIHIVDHGDGFDDECVERSLERGTFLTPSLLYPKVVIAAMPGTPYTDLMVAPFEQMARDLPAINKAGVKLLIGDDYGAMFMDHGRYAEELALYVNEVGIPPLDVIRWATKNGAEAMGLGDQTGTLAAGKLADLVVVNGDPLADITILQDRARLLAVFKCGEAVTDQLGTLEPQRAGTERAPAFAK
jgi:imidazolonepropionase-like amidohydrolase